MTRARRLLVVAMANQAEALRVAVGLTLSDAQIRVAVWPGLPGDAATREQLEALEFGEVPVHVLPADEASSWRQLAGHIIDSDFVYCL